jgi:hypothetical protein
MDTKSTTTAGELQSAAASTGRFLWYWLWLWPGIGLLCVIWGMVDPKAFARCPHVYWTFPLIGLSAAGWTVLRTYEWRYIPQLLASIVVFAIGAWLYWTLP